MAISADTFSRIDKISVDRDECSPEVAAKRRTAVKVPLVCGQEVAGSATLQAAVITAANTANRCFPNSVSLHFLDGVEKAPNLLAAPGKTISAAIRGCVPNVRLDSTLPVDGTPLVFGTRPDVRTGLQVTFNGWIAAAAPVESKFRLPETEACVIAGVPQVPWRWRKWFSRFSMLRQRPPTGWFLCRSGSRIYMPTRRMRSGQRLNICRPSGFHLDSATWAKGICGH